MSAKIVNGDVFYRQVAGLKKVQLSNGMICGISLHYDRNRSANITQAQASRPGTFGYMLVCLSHYQNGKLEVICDGDEYIIKFPEHTVYAKEDSSNNTLWMTRGESTMSGISESIVIAAVAGEKLGIFNDGPEAFCDDVYYNYFMNLSQVTDEEVSESEFQMFTAKVETAVAMKSQPAPASAPKKAKKQKKTSIEEFWDEVKSGKYFINYSGWSNFARSLIPSTDELDEIIPTPEIMRMVKIAYFNLSRALDRLNKGLEPLKDYYVNFMLMGPPCTGKTYACRAVSAALQVPHDAMVCHREQGVAVLEGETHVAHGELDFQSSVIGRSFEEGISVLADEFIESNSDDAVSAFNNAIYGKCEFFKDGYIKVRRHPLSVFYTAFNTMENTGIGNTIAPSLSSRINYAIPMLTKNDDLLEKLIDKYPEEWFDDCDYSKDQVKKFVITAYQWITNSLKDREDLKEFITFRGCEAMIKEICAGIEPQTALTDLYGQLITPDSQEAETIRQGICRVLPNI